MFYNILSRKRKAILPLFKSLKNDFYLAGGTALALQIGHRDSIDFDFFSKKSFDTNILFEKIKNIFKNENHKIQKVQDEENTLTVIADNDIKISFFAYNYPLLKPLITDKYLNIASIEDIACMKLSAITSRSTAKDYVDIYFVLQNKKLPVLLNFAQKKFPSLDRNLILKSLVYFDDVAEEPIIFKNNNVVSFNEVKASLQKAVKDFMNSGASKHK